MTLAASLAELLIAALVEIRQLVVVQAEQSAAASRASRGRDGLLRRPDRPVSSVAPMTCPALRRRRRARRSSLWHCGRGRRRVAAADAVIGRAAELAAPDDERLVQQPSAACRSAIRAGDRLVDRADAGCGGPARCSRASPSRLRRVARSGRRLRPACGPADSGGRKLSVSAWPMP